MAASIHFYNFEITIIFITFQRDGTVQKARIDRSSVCILTTVPKVAVTDCCVTWDNGLPASRIEHRKKFRVSTVRQGIMETIRTGRNVNLALKASSVQREVETPWKILVLKAITARRSHLHRYVIEHFWNISIPFQMKTLIYIFWGFVAVIPIRLALFGFPSTTLNNSNWFWSTQGVF